MRVTNELHQLVAIEHRQALTRIEQERNATLCKLARMPKHAVAAVGRNHAQLEVAGVEHAVVMREVHRARVECGDLVVVQVGGDKRLCGVAPRHVAHMVGAQAESLQALAVRAEVVTDGGHDASVSAQAMEVVGDVAGGATVLPTHLRYQKRHVEHVQLVGKDVFTEAVRENHDGVEGERTTNQNGHCNSRASMPCRQFRGQCVRPA